MRKELERLSCVVIDRRAFRASEAGAAVSRSSRRVGAQRRGSTA